MSFDVFLQRFWEQEEVSSKSISLTPDEQTCEDHFLASNARNEGRYMSFLKLQQLRGSYSSAVKMLLKMENKFKTSPEFYCDFM
ncbi:hypothetical protein J437_LFUL014626 [Ladona fulva]|uniref:Uncharacterized protein n=1 Tax=Ladona fulva TaxID=123851 RepID=A0A8K0KQM0_LADFU|nr:hypothetical protein J437_LFUL014626 [Ladona fulva]